MAARALEKISPDHPHHDGGVQQSRRRRFQIGDFQERPRQRGIVLRRHVQLADVPVDETHLWRTRSLNLRVAQVVADGNVPRHIDDARRGLEKRRARPSRPPLRQLSSATACWAATVMPWP